MELELELELGREWTGIERMARKGGGARREGVRRGYADRDCGERGRWAGWRWTWVALRGAIKS